MSYSWFRSGTCTVANGSDVVRFQNAQLTTSPTKPVEGDAFTIDGTKFYETIFIGSDSAGEYIKLQQPYSGASASNAKYAIARFASGTQNAKLVAMATAAINQKQISLDDMEEWFTSTSDTVDFSNPDGSISTITTYHKLTKEISAVGGNSAEISTVAANIASITNVSGNMTAVIDAKPQADRSKLEADRAEEAADRAEAAENTVIAQGNTQVSRVLSEGNTQVGLVVSSGDQQVSRVISEGGSQVALATAQADRAKDEADKASISASSIYGMSQAQFEAIRAQNNEKYAASGFVHFGKHYTDNNNWVAINEGLWTNTVGENNLQLGKSPTPSPTGKSKSDAPVVHVAGAVFTLQEICAAAENQNQIKFPQAPDGKTTYNKATGVVTTHATVTAAFDAQAADPTNVEVVINRVDMWGFEAFLEEVNTTNPYVYPNGLIQSQATGMDGIATSASARPVTYYAVFDGDTGSKGKGLNFFTLTDAQKKKVLGNHKNNLYYLDDGRLVQWRLRVRSFAGRGNGDWNRIENTAVDALNYYGGKYASAQGGFDTPSPTAAHNDDIFLTTSHPNGHGLIGLFSTSTTSPRGVNGHCYFLVCGTVNRLNQGAYHSSFNPSGAGSFIVSNGSIPTVWSGDVLNVPTSTLHCFIKPTSPYPYTDGYQYPTSSNGANVGSIAGAGSGRPDGRYYDAIYASGQGGVCRDMRYSANGVDAVDFAEADQRVKNGTYRGFEKVVFSKVTKAILSNSLNGLLLNKDSSSVGWVSGYKPKGSSSGLGFTNEAKVSVVLDGVVIAKGKLSQPERVHSDGSWYAIVYWDNDGIPTNTTYPCNDASFLIIQDVMSSSVGGSFLQTDVIGNPANILATPALANGWQGSWGGIPVEGGLPVYGTRKMISSGLLTFSVNNGATWDNGQLPQPNSDNVTTSTYSNYEIRICQYQAFAKQTENAVNAAVYGSAAGVGNVYASAFQDKTIATLCESLISKIPKSVSHPAFRTYILTSLEFIVDKLHPYAPFYTPTHTALNLANPESSSPAFKALNYNASINQQAFVHYAYTELRNNGTNWGDDGKVTIVDNQSTKTDLNGNTVLVGTAKLKESIGWIKIKV